jgi:hypothetical protein
MTVIDHPEQVERLMERLGTTLPIPARLTPEVQMTLRQQRGVTMPANCSVTWISYAGDEGGIVCRLEASAETAEAVFASLPAHNQEVSPVPLTLGLATQLIVGIVVGRHPHRGSGLACGGRTLRMYDATFTEN